MVGTREKHRDIVSRRLENGEALRALINVHDGSTGVNGLNASGRYRAEHGIAERGLNGHFDLPNVWLALTDRRLVVFSGSWFSLAPKPKELLTTFPVGTFAVSWRDLAAPPRTRLLHFLFPDDQHIVRHGEADDESDRFLAALGTQAAPMAGS